MRTSVKKVRFNLFLFECSENFSDFKIITVRTPLTSVLSYIDIALDGPLDTETKEAISSTNSKSLVRVINDLLIASRDRLEGKIPLAETISLASLSLVRCFVFL